MKTMLCAALLTIGLGLSLTPHASAQTFVYPYYNGNVVDTRIGSYSPAYGYSQAYGYSPAYGYSSAYGYSPAYSFAPRATYYYPNVSYYSAPPTMYRYSYTWWR